MKKITLTKGSEVFTLDGKLVAIEYNGSVIHFNEYLYNEETEESDIDNGIRSLTLSEVGHIMQDYEGTDTYKVRWEEEA